MSTTMTAAVYTGYGAPDVLQIKDVAKPVPMDNQVLIKIHATTVEAADATFRQGRTASARLFTGFVKPRFAIPGSEFAGEIEALGNGVTHFKHGDRVVGTGGPTFGANAEYICLGEDARWHANRTV
jgi:NADPH:quinone reductase-like Zn-dependent oxidoreductase